MAPQPTATQHWRRALDGRDTASLITLAEQVDDLTKQPGWDALMELLAEGREFVVSSLLNGPTRDLAGYARATGYGAGLEELGNAVSAIRTAAARRQKELEERNRAESPAAEEVHA